MTFATRWPWGTLLAVPDEAEVAAFWLGDSTLEVSPVPGGATNTVFRVDASHGTYYLRRYRRLTPDGVRREHRLIGHARQRGVATPLPLALGEKPAHARAIGWCEGSTVLEVDGVAYAVFEAAQGCQLEPCDINDGHAHFSGKALAFLHEATASHDGEGLGSWRLSWGKYEWLARLERIEQAIASRPVLSEADQWALDRVRQQEEWIADPDCPHACRPTSRSQVIHGDYQHANLFFDGESVSSVIDWDTATVMPRAYEVVRACAFMFQLEPSLTLAFLQGYRSACELTSEDLADGARAWGCFSDHHVWPLEEAYLHGNLAAARFIPHRPFVPFAQAWGELALR